jgi:hypothetical protein
MIKLSNFLNEREVGETEIDSKTGIKTTLTNIDPETDKYSWDVSYEVDPQFLYNKLNDLVIYLRKAEEGSELAKFRDILKNLKNKTARVINQKK